MTKGLALLVQCGSRRANDLESANKSPPPHRTQSTTRTQGIKFFAQHLMFVGVQRATFLHPAYDIVDQRRCNVHLDSLTARRVDTEDSVRMPSLHVNQYREAI
ncbi:hypothetical protein Aduo_014648 [Ancylostoma duodenale]